MENLAAGRPVLRRTDRAWSSRAQVDATLTARRAPDIRMLWGLLLLSAACATPPHSRMPDAVEQPAPAATPLGAAQAEALWSQASEVLERRCVVCHGCYDAPCQLKLESYSGVRRGASAERVYDASRLTAMAPTRLDIDAHEIWQWRQRGFHAVIAEPPRTDLEDSLLLRLLEQKRAHPLTAQVDFGAAFSFDLNREQSCVEQDKFAEFEREHPLWGMPYGLPAIAPEEHEALRAFIVSGAARAPEVALSGALEREVEKWEAYLNEPSLKRKLIARYLYEHLFLGALYFRGVDDAVFFRMVRSRTPHGFAVDEIATRRPFEDPGEQTFFYRVIRRQELRLDKTHMPYALDDARLSRFQQLFDAPDYQVKALPGYQLETASNPFRSFDVIPVVSRYQFLLDEAQYFLMGFIKGPVCRGQVALNVIQERFWVSFVAPDSPSATKLAEELAGLQARFDLPAEAGSNALPFAWFREADEHARYVRKRNQLVASGLRAGVKLTTDLIWDGDGTNSNAALTVFRHFDSASVVRGFVGGPPKTAWVMDYPMFERIHYLLVAGFDVFGNVGHQIMTRLYMDFLRMEGEANYLTLLPSARRSALARDWYRGVSARAWRRIQEELAGLSAEPNIKYKTAQPELELDQLLTRRLAKVMDRRYQLFPDDPLGARLAPLEQIRGPAATAMPELSFLEVAIEHHEPRYFSIMRDSAHTNVAQLFDEDQRRVPADDVLRVVPGFLGAYPNAIFHVARSDLEALVGALTLVKQPVQYQALRERYGVLRYSPDFWPTSDRMHDSHLAKQPIEFGVFDYNRLQAP